MSHLISHKEVAANNVTRDKRSETERLKSSTFCSLIKLVLHPNAVHTNVSVLEDPQHAFQQTEPSSPPQPEAAQPQSHPGEGPGPGEGGGDGVGEGSMFQIDHS